MMETNLFPSKISLSKRIRAISENNDCICKHCGVIHGDVAKAGYCCHKCYIGARKKSEISEDDFPVYNAIRLGERKFADKLEGIDYMICNICAAKTGELGTHIRLHGISSDDYKTKYNLITLKNQKQIANVTGAKNPAYNHGGEFSPFSEKFIYAESTDRTALVSRAARTRSDNDNETTRLGYWLKQTAGDVDSAEILLKNRQSTFSLTKCIEKHGDEIGHTVWKSRQEKWSKNFKKVNFSKISQILFNEIIQQLPDELKTSIYYATLDRPDMRKYKNKEYILDVGKTYIRPDFICLDIGKIIEFDGDYWHSAAKVNPIREANRDKMIIDAGMDVLHIREQDYKKNKEETVEKCIKFLTQ